MKKIVSLIMCVLLIMPYVGALAADDELLYFKMDDFSESTDISVSGSSFSSGTVTIFGFVHSGAKTAAMTAYSDAENQGIDTLIGMEQTDVESDGSFRFSFGIGDAKGGIINLKAADSDSIIYARFYYADGSELLNGLETMNSEIGALLKKCEKAEIPVEYERVGVTVFDKFSGFLRDDLVRGDSTYLSTHYDTLKSIYNEVSENLYGLLNGSVVPKRTFKYQTSKETIDGSAVIADAFDGEKIEKRPVFYTGFGHWEYALSGSEYFDDLGLNFLHAEIGPSEVLFHPDVAKEWEVISGGFVEEGTKVELTADESDGNHFITMHGVAPRFQEGYIGISQTIDVEPNKTYNFGFKIKGSVLSNGTYYKIGNAPRVCIMGEYDGFKTVTATYKTAADETKLSVAVSMEKDGGEFYLDDFYLTKKFTVVNLIRNPGFEEGKASWHKYWKENKITVECRDDFIGKAVIFAQYHLYIMASGEDNRLGIGAKAMSGEGYKGHSYWDTELFLLPYYIYNAPKIARNLLEYRYKLLDDSMKKAKELGYIGAMYPWESAWIDDGDAADKYCGVDTVTGMVKRLWFSEKEIHVTAAVAYGVWHYYMATHDDDFMERCGFEIVVLTALFWTSRVEKVNGRYEILDVIGPDEYKGNVNNNAYTNYMAMHNMRYAGQILKNCPEALYAKLNKEYGVEEIKRRIDDVVGNIYLPKAEDDGIISQFDGCKNLIEIDLSPYKNINKVATIFADFGNDEIYARQMYKQADLVMLFYLMRDMFTDEEIRKNYVYYEKRTLHDSSLSMCIHSIVAARYGMDDIADDMFYKACCVDLGDNTDNSDEGIHAASLGGIWLMIAQGYGGLEVNEKGLFVDPILPNGWSEYSFCIYYKGTRLKITVNGSGCIIKRLSGDEVSIFLNGEEKTV